MDIIQNVYNNKHIGNLKRYNIFNGLNSSFVNMFLPYVKRIYLKKNDKVFD
jgi:hypothetical protein